VFAQDLIIEKIRLTLSNTFLLITFDIPSITDGNTCFFSKAQETRISNRL